MQSRDGKYYLTDTADASTILEIIKFVPKATAEAFELLVADIENRTVSDTGSPSSFQDEEDCAAKLLVDGYHTKDSIIITAMIAGLSLEDISILVTKKCVTISGKRLKEDVPHAEYLYEELLWVTFSRTIALPSPVVIESLRRSERNGMITIELDKLRK